MCVTKIVCIYRLIVSVTFVCQKWNKGQFCSDNVCIIFTIVLSLCIVIIVMWKPNDFNCVKSKARFNREKNYLILWSNWKECFIGLISVIDDSLSQSII